MPPQTRRFRKAQPLYEGVQWDGTPAGARALVDWLQSVWPGCDLARIENGVLLYPDAATMSWKQAPTGMLWSLRQGPANMEYLVLPPERISHVLDEET